MSYKCCAPGCTEDADSYSCMTCGILTLCYHHHLEVEMSIPKTQMDYPITRPRIEYFQFHKEDYHPTASVELVD